MDPELSSSRPPPEIYANMKHRLFFGSYLAVMLQQDQNEQCS